MQTTGAIVAAARIKKWGFAPMLATSGNILIRRIIMTLKSAGINPIVVVTGANDERLRQSLSGPGIEFIHNEGYKESRLIESVRLGWQCLDGKCDRFLIARADIPLFTVGTVNSLLQSGNDIALPVYHGLEGHPILINSRLASSLLSWERDGGLREAIREHTGDIDYIAVEDEGVISATASIGDAEQEVKKQPEWELEMDIRLRGKHTLIDETMASFLMLLDNSATIAEACSVKGISEGRASAYIKNLQDDLGTDVITTDSEGKHELSQAARELLTCYVNGSKDILRAASAVFGKYINGGASNGQEDN